MASLQLGNVLNKLGMGRMSSEKQETLLKLLILVSAAILCEHVFVIFSLKHNRNCRIFVYFFCDLKAVWCVLCLYVCVCIFVCAFLVCIYNLWKSDQYVLISHTILASCVVYPSS